MTTVRIDTPSRTAAQVSEHTDLSTVLITNGNLLSMLSLGDWLAEHGHHLRAVIITTKLPSTKSNVRGLFDMFRKSGLAYTFFKLNTNRFLPARFALCRLPTTIPDLLHCYHLSPEVLHVDNVNDPAVIERIRAYAPRILLSFSATSRFCDELIAIPSRVSINVHYALLPEYAGLSPYYWYLHNREPQCGITMHVIHSKLDAGPIICQERFLTLGIRSVLGLLNRQMELVSPVLCRFYAGELHENDAEPQDLRKRSYFRHPTREQLAEFRHNGLVFATRSAILQMAETARRLRDRLPIRAATISQPARCPDVVSASADTGNCWYIPPKRMPRSSWLVYSLDFTLATLQGCVAEPQRVRRSWPWLIAGSILRTLIAFLQLIIMILAWIPVVSWLVETFARTFTRNAAGFFLRSCYWKSRLRHLGPDTIIDQNVEIWGPANVSIGAHCHIDTNVRLAAGERRHGQRGSITIGDYVHLGPGVHIAGRGGVEIGDFVGISANAHLYSATNSIQDPADPGQLISMSHMAPPNQQKVYEAPVIIEDYAFVGMMARIMPGVRIGRGAVIHSNVELTKSVLPFANVGGIPRGRQIGWRRPRRRSPKLKDQERSQPSEGCSTHDEV